MDHAPFYLLQKRRVAEGQRMLAAASRALLRRMEPGIHPLVSNASDEVFLEPLLFAYFSALKAGQPQAALPQLLLGYVDPAHWPQAIEVYADRRGCVCLPRLGYLLTAVRDRRLTLRCHRAGERFTLEERGVPVAFTFEEPLRIPGTSIEVCRYPNGLYEALLADSSGKHRAVELTEDAPRYVSFITRALAVIQEHLPDFHQDLLRTLRHVVLFRSHERNSCATLGAHGAVFINVAGGGEEVFFVDDLVHQGGHVIFNAFTAKRADFCAIDPQTPFGEVSGDTRDKRSLYTVLHGAYTEFAMSSCLLSCANQRGFPGQQGHELIGRLASIFQRSLLDMKNLDRPGLFTEQGRFLYSTFRLFSEEVRLLRPDLLDYDLSNQPYTFSYERFTELNPRARQPAARTA